MDSSSQTLHSSLLSKQDRSRALALVPCGHSRNTARLAVLKGSFGELPFRNTEPTPSQHRSMLPMITATEINCPLAKALLPRETPLSLLLRCHCWPATRLCLSHCVLLDDCWMCSPAQGLSHTAGAADIMLAGCGPGLALGNQSSNCSVWRCQGLAVGNPVPSPE